MMQWRSRARLLADHTIGPRSAFVHRRCGGSLGDGTSLATLSGMTKCATGLLVFAVAFGLVAGCGGTALRDGGGATAGSGNESGSSFAGARAHGGSPSSSAGSGGSSSAGAPSGNACTQPNLSGNCDGYFPSFWHNPQNGLCEPFIYGGCGGNENRFATREECIAQCGGGGSAKCAVDSDCTFVNLDCCGCEPIDEHRIVALNQMYKAKYSAQLCANVGQCAPCQALDETKTTGKYFKPVCVEGACSVVDIRTTKLTACSEVKNDCVLRNGTGCCQGCGQTGWVAVNQSADFCGDGPVPCPACASMPPGGLVASCGEDGACRLDYFFEK